MRHLYFKTHNFRLNRVKIIVMKDIGIKTWPGWETVRVLGRGNFGTVYEIERDVLGQKEKAALRVVTIPQSSSDIDELRRNGYDDASITDTVKSCLKNIIDEYAMMRKLNGTANVVNCDDVRYVRNDDGYRWDIYIKMELLTPLLKRLGDTVPEKQVVRIGADICKALMLSEKYNIVHQEIKPSDIFVSENEEYKLDDGYLRVARIHEDIGVHFWAPPEFYKGNYYSGTADIYSLGLVLYWLLNERRVPFLPLLPKWPYASDIAEAFERRINGEKLPAPAHGSRKLQKVILKACALKPKDRYQNAEEFYNALQSTQDNGWNIMKRFFRL